MRIGVVGAGNMASALVRGWARPVALHDPRTDHAEALAAEVGGRALPSNVAVARESDVVVLCHKPTQLGEVAAELGDEARVVVSILGGTPLDALEAAYPERPVYRFMPNISAEQRQGVFCVARGSAVPPGPDDEVIALFGELGSVFELPDPLIEPATALMGCSPAFFALVVEGLVDAGVRSGLPADVAGRITVEAMAGAAASLRAAGDDTAEVRRRVTSPGGSTERGLAALEQHGAKAAFGAAVEATLPDRAR